MSKGDFVLADVRSFR